MRRIRITSALLGLALSGLMAPNPASAASTTTVDVTSATVVARGSAVDITTTVVCPAGTTAFLSLSLTQRSGSGVAQGGGSASATCTGEPQNVTLRALAQAGGSIFRPGEAVVTGDFYSCNDVQCEWVQVSDTVRVTQN